MMPDNPKGAYPDWRMKVASSRMDKGVQVIDRDYISTLRRFCDAAEASTVLEIGIGPEGKSGITFAGSMGVGGLLYSIDIDPDRPRPQDRQAALHFGVRWEVIHGDSLTVNVELANELDLLYIDGDHDYTHALGDFLRFEPYVREGGYILVDDYPSFMGVVEAVQELENRGWKGLFLPYDAENNGHMIYRKPGFMAPWVKDSNAGTPVEVTYGSTLEKAHGWAE